MRVLVDMNLSPRWVETLSARGIPTVHWSSVGDPGARDRVIMEWARANGHVVLTHDLDFGTILAATGSDGPSVVQVRTSDPFPERIGGRVAEALKQNEGLVEAGALIVIDEQRERIRILPLRRRS